MLRLIAQATAADGTPPFSEDAVLRTRHAGPAVHVLASEPTTGSLVGVAQVEGLGADLGPSIELAVHPQHRNQGIGTALLDSALAQCPRPPGPVRLWSHGQDAAAGHLARARGFTTERHLWQLRRSLLDPLPPLDLPAGLAVRRFDPEHDFEALLHLNAAAFTDLPDQGGLTANDLRRRMAEPWFDPEGLLLAAQTGADGGEQLLGFHWTKVHAVPDAGPRLGEVYVVGVHPRARGPGLGRTLTIAGLEHLRELGLTVAGLYVDGTNARALDLYASLGFEKWDSDTLFRR